MSYAARAGESGTFRVTAVDYDNKPVQTTVHLQLVYRRWSNGKTETANGGTTDVTTDARGDRTGHDSRADCRNRGGRGIRNDA